MKTTLVITQLILLQENFLDDLLGFHSQQFLIAKTLPLIAALPILLYFFKTYFCFRDTALEKVNIPSVPRNVLKLGCIFINLYLLSRIAYFCFFLIIILAQRRQGLLYASREGKVYLITST